MARPRAQLATWKSLVRPIVREGGILLIDADEANNRVRVGVANETAQRRVTSRLHGLGIPAGALDVVVVRRNKISKI